MNQTLDEFFQDFRQEVHGGASANNRQELDEFMDVMTREIIESGRVGDYTPCYYGAQKGMRVDGYHFDEDDHVLSLFVADFDSRSELESLTRTEVDSAYRRVEKFFNACATKALAEELEITSSEYGLARLIADRLEDIYLIRLFLVSERNLSDRVQETIEDRKIAGKIVKHEAPWDISMLHRVRSSRAHKEPLDIDLLEKFGKTLPFLPAHLQNTVYKSYLLVVPGDVLVSLYGDYGARLMEQNVRTFLQVRGDVNKGIRETILKQPEMFFAYNNGVTATAQEVEVDESSGGIRRIRDLQIVNGGQTTASLFHAQKRDKARLSKVFVQMKLSVIDETKIDEVVPNISRYANTQNKVSSADLFSNGEFHVRLEGFSRRLLAPLRDGAVRQTKWFYERARGQYADGCYKGTVSDQRRFKAEYPREQMFTKTDLAKFENVWDDHPRWVNLGAQKNFVRYAERIGKEWKKDPDSFNENYFKTIVARAIIFREAERVVSNEPWYGGGYRANIVAYALAALGEVARRRNSSIDFLAVWVAQQAGQELRRAIALAAKVINEVITKPQSGVSNVTEWCKKEACWDRILERIDDIDAKLPEVFLESLISRDQKAASDRSARRAQKEDNAIAAQKRVLDVGADGWTRICKGLLSRGLLTPGEEQVVRFAMQIPLKIPTDRQSKTLVDVLARAKSEGVV